MPRLRELVFRVQTLFHRRRRESDLDAELQFHLDAEMEEGVADGRSPIDARYAAKRHLGNIVLAKEDTRRAWQWVWMEELLQDLRYAVRVLRRRPVFTATALLSLTLGIGANTAVVSLLDSLLWKPLPVHQPHELVRLARPDDTQEAETYATYESIRQRSQTVTDVIAMTRQTSRPGEVEERGERSPAFVQLVSDEFFDALGIVPLHGRVFHAPTPAQPREPVAVISHAYWQAHYAGDLSAVGSHLTTHLQDFTIVGIAPPAFRGTDIDFPIDIWIPFEQVVPVDYEGRSRGRWVQVLGRLKPGESLTSAATEVSVIAGRPTELRHGAAGFSTLRFRLSRPLLLLALVTGLVLLITCANLANLALASATARDREVAVRQAIGASRGRVARQLLTESLVLAGMGSVLALMAAPWMSAALLSYLPPAQARALTNLSFTFDWRIVVFVTLLAVVTCLLVGLIPALRTTRRHATAAVKISAGSGQRTRSWTSRGLVVVEVALCTMLLVTAGVFVRTMQNLHGQDAGYVAERLLVADISPSQNSSTQWNQIVDVLRERISTLPGVETAAFSHIGQLSGSGIQGEVRVPGTAAATDDNTRYPYVQRVSVGFLTAMGTRFISGRDFTERDDQRAAPVAIVNEEFARRHFPGLDPVGRHFIRWGSSPDSEILTEVVGVVRDSKWVTLREEPRPMFYLPYRQQSSGAGVTFVVRSQGNLDSLGAQLVQVAHAIDPQLQVSNVVPFREIVNRTLVIERLVAHVSTAFAALGLLIAAIGLYGILAYAVVRRTREIGVRIAMGATPGTVEWLFVRESLVLLVAGFAIGLPAAILVTRSVSTMLFGLEPGDPITVGVTLVALTTTAMAASFIPARRAARIDPVRALRAE